MAAAPGSGGRQLLSVFHNSIRATASGRAQLGAAAAGAPNLAAAAVGAGAPLEIPADIVTWLAQLTLLYGVPFEYLVADAAMLPPESIRFFYIDQNWTNRLVDGAVNIALGSSQDYVHILTTFEETAQQAALAQNNVRAQLRRKPLADTVEVDGTLSGLLLRSAVVSGWPGVDVQAFADTTATRPLPLLRMDRLSDNVLLCLFNGVPRLVNFSEPPEGLHFGVIGGGKDGSYQVALRGVGDKYPAGEQINDAQEMAYTSPVTFRDNNRANGVLDIARIKNDLIANMNKLGALQMEDGAPVFTASQFAVEMVKGAGLQQFKYGTPATDAESSGAAPELNPTMVTA